MDGVSAKARDPAKFKPFLVYGTRYRTDNGHEIGLDLLVPKGLKPGTQKHPLIVRFHGGFLVTGGSLQPVFFINWILDLARLKDAIIVSADYRLLPEATGQDILRDIHHLWRWVYSDLQEFLSVCSLLKPQVDLFHILVVGESSGGWLAMQSALREPAGSIKAVIGLYPQLDMADPFYREKFDKPLFGRPIEPNEFIDEHVATRPHGAVVTNHYRTDLACSIARNGRIVEFLGEHKELFPVGMVSQAKRMPAVLILHGRDDRTVPVSGSEKFVKELKKVIPECPVRLDVRAGGEHGFDCDATMEEEWLKEDVEFITRYWLG